VRRPILLLICGLAAALAWSSPALAGGFTKTDVTITMSDGVPIAATFFEPTTPAPPAGWPAVMIFHGLGQTRNSTELGNISWNGVAETLLAPNGYAVLTFDARAHGQSGGMFTLDGPRELQDTKELFAWLVSHREIDAQHVGAFGVSYGGANIWLSAASGVPFATIVPAATWTDLRNALAPQDLGRSGLIYGFSQDVDQSRIPAEEKQLLLDTLAQRNLVAVRAYLAARSVASSLDQIHVPVFMIQGRRDFAFDADQALQAFRALRVPKRLYLGDLGHAPAANPPAEWSYVETEVLAWFDRWLKGVPNGIDKRPAVEVAPDPWSSRTSGFRAVPATRSLTFTLGGSASLASTGKIVRTSARRLPHEETFGAATVRVSLRSSTLPWLVAVLTAVRRDGTEVLVADGGAGLDAGVGQRREITIRLADEVTSIPAGARMRIYVGGTSTIQNSANAVYLNLPPAGTSATVGRVKLTLGVLRKPVSR